MRRYRGQDQSVLAIVTIGVDILLITDLTRRIGTDVLSLGDPWGDRVVHLGPVTVPQTRIAAILAAGLLITVFLLVFRHTSWGVAMRAAAERPEAAALMGVRLGRVSLAAWAVAGALAAVAALFLTVFPTPGLERATSSPPSRLSRPRSSAASTPLPAPWPGADRRSHRGAGHRLPESVGLPGRGIGDLAPYLVMVVVLLIRPAGLLGTKELTRV